MKVQFFNAEDMVNEIQEILNPPEVRQEMMGISVPAINIRIQSIRRNINKEAGMPFMEFEVQITARVKDEIWYYVRYCGSKIVFDKEDIEEKIKEMAEEEKKIRDIFKGFEIRKGIYQEE